MDTGRGPHSTGVLGVFTNKESLVVKHLGTPWDFYDHKSSDKIFARTTNVLLGHNRWATSGAVSNKNAHPFEFDKIVGAHNGTLRSVFNLDDSKDFEVDSENLYHHMNRHGVHDTIPIINGAFALTWYDKEEETINFIRNSERTLFYAFSADKKSLLWASEKWMIIIAASQSGMEITDILDVPEGYLHTFKVPFGFPAKEFEATRVRKVPLYKSPVVVSIGTKAAVTTTTATTKKEEVGKVKRPFAEYNKFVGGFHTFYAAFSSRSGSNQPYIQCWLIEQEDIAVRVFPEEGGELWERMMNSNGYFGANIKAYNGTENGYLTIDMRTIIDVPSINDDPEETVKGFDGEDINEEEFDVRTKSGCAWCASPIYFPMSEGMHWVGKNEFICPDCADHPEVKKYLIAEK